MSGLGTATHSTTLARVDGVPFPFHQEKFVGLDVDVDSGVGGMVPRRETARAFDAPRCVKDTARRAGI